jgi:hypothetical protein
VPPPIRHTWDRTVTAVGKLLEAGYVPRIEPRPPERFAMLREASARWARSDGDRLADAGPVTPAHGEVLDHLVYLDADEEAGELHRHSYGGAQITHRHQRGQAPHFHTTAEPRASWAIRPA